MVSQKVQKLAIRLRTINKLHGVPASFERFLRNRQSKFRAFLHGTFCSLPPPECGMPFWLSARTKLFAANGLGAVTK